MRNLTEYINDKRSLHEERGISLSVPQSDPQIVSLQIVWPKWSISRLDQAGGALLGGLLLDLLQELDLTDLVSLRGGRQVLPQEKNVATGGLYLIKHTHTHTHLTLRGEHKAESATLSTPGSQSTPPETLYAPNQPRLLIHSHWLEKPPFGQIPSRNPPQNVQELRTVRSRQGPSRSQCLDQSGQSMFVKFTQPFRRCVSKTDRKTSSRGGANGFHGRQKHNSIEGRRTDLSSMETDEEKRQSRPTLI